MTARRPTVAALNRKGLTLVEILVALVVLLLVALALMQTALVSIEANMKNVLRDEAVSIADQRMNDTKSLPYNTTTDAIVSGDTAAMKHSDNTPVTAAECPAGFGTTGVFIERSFRNMAPVGFCTLATATDLDANTKQIVVTVGWKWRGEDYSHTYTSIVGRKGS